MRRKEERMSAFLLADDESDDDYVYNHSAREGDNDADTLHISLDRFISSSSSSSSSLSLLILLAFFLVSVKRSQTDLITVFCFYRISLDSPSPSYACEACSRDFASAAQLQQHEASKVHRKRIQELTKKKTGTGKKQQQVNADP